MLGYLEFDKRRIKRGLKMKYNYIEWCRNCPKYLQVNKTSMVGCFNYTRCKKALREVKKAYKNLEYTVGDKIYFKGDKKPFRIQACNERYIIATKPFNLKKTFLYTIVDFERCVRGRDNHYCAFEYDDPKEAAEALKCLETQEPLELCVSYRHFIPLDILHIVKG